MGAFPGRIHIELIRCVKRAIETKCGAAAGQLIRGFANAQVPRQISRDCVGIEQPSAANSRLHGHVAALVTWLAGWVVLLCIAS